MEFEWVFMVEEEDYQIDMRPPKRAKMSLCEQYPQLTDVVNKFVQDNSAEAHDRRRNSSAYSNGVSLGDIQRHVQRTIPGLESISKMTIHRLMKPARRGTTNAKRHRETVDARVPPKRNNATNDHADFRFSCASVNYLHEMAAMCRQECLSLSCDDKNKINVGTLAVSRYFQIKGFFSTNDSPNYPDHDFPIPNSKLIPSGYMRLTTRTRRRSLSPSRPPRQTKTRSRSLSPPRRQLPHDNLAICAKTGRSHVPWPRTGPLDVVLQAGKFHNSTSQSHANHLFRILSQTFKDPLNTQSVVTILADGGPDWTTKSLVNLVSYGRLWRDLRLDGLYVTAYAPKHSRQNPVERAWAPLSKWLTGVTLKRTLPGENLLPEQQGLPEDETQAKEAAVFDKAVQTCSKYWNDKTYDGFKIKTHCIPCMKPVGFDQYTDHNVLKTFVTASGKQIKNNNQYQALKREVQFLMAHCVRRTYHLEFFKCQKAACNHCMSFPIKATQFYNLLTDFGGKLPSPVIDIARTKGEFMTFMRLKDNPRYVTEEMDFEVSGSVEACDRGCHYVFASAADKKRHNLLIHS